MVDAGADAHRIARAVLDRSPRTAAEDLGIRSLGTPSGLFRLFVTGHDYVRLVDGRVRVDLDDAYDDVRDAA